MQQYTHLDGGGGGVARGVEEEGGGEQGEWGERRRRRHEGEERHTLLCLLFLGGGGGEALGSSSPLEEEKEGWIQGDKEGEGGVGGNEGIGNADDTSEKDATCGPSSPFHLRRRQRNPGLLLPCLQAMSNGSGSGIVFVQTNKHKDYTSK